MLPFQSTLAKDPSLLPLCGVGTAVPSAMPAGPAGDDVCGAADFGTLIADLNPVASPEETAVPDLGAAGMALFGSPFAPPPLAPGLIPDLTAPAGGELSGADETPARPGEESGPWAGRAGVRSGWTERDGPAGFAGGPGRADLVRFPARVADAAFDGVPAASLPGETPSGQATPAPRTSGLPAVALEHRQAATLPPGLTRLQALSAASSTPPGASVAGDEPAADLPALPDPAVTGPHVPFRGAVLTKPEHPADAARAALERNGFVVGETAAAAAGSVPPAGPAPRPEEKNAGRFDAAASGAGESALVRKKSFLAQEEEPFAKHGRALGIDGAKSAAVMSATSLLAPPTHPNSDYTVTAVAPSAPALSEVRAAVDAADTISTAHEAVEVVLHAVEHVAAREQKSVQLKFSVAGEDLAVRVEMRADEVRTTFRTDSAELRAALAYEWQQVAGASPSSERTARLAPAVFASAGHPAPNAFAGDTPSRDRRTGPSRGEFDQAIAGIRGRAVAAAAQGVPLPDPAAPVRSGRTHRLHTLA